MKNKKKHIELTVDEISNVKKISFVKDPAVEVSFQYFNKDVFQFAKVNNEKRIVTGLAMRPNKDIPRINKFTGEEYSVSFSSETVRKASELYLKDGHQKDTNLEHKYDIEGVCLVESYIINDKEVNNAVALGFKDVELNDWWVSMKVYNDELWEKFIKAGEVTGFSVEGQFIDSIATEMERKEFNKHKKENKDMDKVIDLLLSNINDLKKCKDIINEYNGVEKFEAYKTSSQEDIYIDGDIAIDSYVYCNKPQKVLINDQVTEMKYPYWNPIVELEDGTILELADGKIVNIKAKE